MKIKNDKNDVNNRYDKNVICPICGGDGVTMNQNHLLADLSPDCRYVTCWLCYGLEKITPQKYEEYRKSLKIE